MTTTQLAPVQPRFDTHTAHDRGTQRSRQATTSPTPMVGAPGGNPSSGSSHAEHDTQLPFAAAGPNPPTGHRNHDAHVDIARGALTSEQAARVTAMPTPAPLPVRTQRAESITPTNTHLALDSAPSSGGSHRPCDTQSSRAATGSHSPTGQLNLDAQRKHARGGHTSTGTGAKVAATPKEDAPRPGGFLRDPLLGTLADVLDDLEGIRIANANRVRILTRNQADGDGEERGHGLTEDNPEVAKLIFTVKAMEQLEHDATLNLQRAMRKHPLGAFVKRTVGLGEKQTARLIATIGDPYWNDLHDKPRTVGQLRAYCGLHSLHGVAPKRTRGQKSNWSEDARKRTWLIASAIPKFKDSPYEPVYRAARVKYVDAVHRSECVRCGPKGKPAPAGSPLSLGHQNARAHRIVGQEILKDLWLESRALYGEIA